MKKLIILLAIPLLIYGAYRLVYPTYSWNQKLTLVVDTPDGVKTGSSVVRIEVGFDMQILPDAPGFSSNQRGEAVVVDLGGGRTLFALMKGNKSLARKALAKQRSETVRMDSEKVYRLITRIDAPLTLPPDALPMLVTFDDVTDPKTVRLVAPGALAASFGAGYALREATLEITRDPVTEGVVEGVLGWLHGHSGKIKPTKKRYADELLPEERLYKNDFIKE